MSIAMLWMVTLGGEQEINHPQWSIQDCPLTDSITSTPTLSCFVPGLLTVIAQLLNGQSLSFGRLFPLYFNRFSHFTSLNSS